MGFITLVAKKKARLQAQNSAKTFTTNPKIPFSLTAIMTAIGGVENYIKNTATLHSITFFVKDVSKVQRDALIRLGAKGTIFNAQSVICLFGDYSKTLSAQIMQHYSTT